jgi:hypothetical protein
MEGDGIMSEGGWKGWEEEIVGLKSPFVWCSCTIAVALLIIILGRIT